ncbi:MAG: hypothetical protein PWP54_1274 [Thermosipho sp. (in: thermotogales)]|jgi:sporulation protein YlmC with PRC-barrel domain|nr:hypothetical protein [Thermosipho sp. (in: thermotogales)]MDN5324440.1 hypothetical protein [Thermosipho sp. (in: thermotogales)]
MKKSLVLLVSVLFIGGLFAFPFNLQTSKPLNYEGIIQKLKNIEVSDPATYVGTIKEVYIELDKGISKSKIVLATEDGTDVEIYIGPMWRFIDLKPGMQVELQAVEIKLNDNNTFELAFELSSNGITIEIPYKKIIRERLELMKKMAYQRRMLQEQRFRRMPMYQYGPMMPYYGYPQMQQPKQIPQMSPYPQKGWK